MTRRRVCFDTKVLRAEAKKKFKTLQSFADALGVDRSQISHILRKGYCQADTMKKLADTLGIPCKDLAPESVSHNKPLMCRIERGISVEELVAKSGVSRTTIGTLESGTGNITAFNAFCLAKALGLTMDEYLGYED